MPTYDDILKEKERRKKRSESQQRCIANKAAKESPEETRARKEENNRRKREIKAIMHGKDPKAEEAAFQKRKLGHQVRRQMEKDKKAAEEQATGYESNDSRELLTSDNRSVGPARPEGPTYPDPPRQDHNATFAMTSMRSSLPPTISTQPATSHDHSSSMSDPQHSAHTSYHDSSSMNNSEYLMYPSYQKPTANSRSDLRSTSYHNSGPRMNNNNNPSLLAKPMMPVEHESTRTRTLFASPISNYCDLSSVTNYQSPVPHSTQMPTANSRSDLPPASYYNPGPRINKNKSPSSLARSSAPRSSGSRSSDLTRSSGLPRSSGSRSSGLARSSDLTKPVRLAEHESARLRTPFAPPINSHRDLLSVTNHQPSVSHNTQIPTAYSGYDPTCINKWWAKYEPKQDEKGNFCDEKGNFY